MTGRRHLRPAIILTCEHGGNEIPARYRDLFRTPSAQAALQTHRGWDPGSLTMARHFRRRLKAPLIANTTSRLLIELNRSMGHARLFSEWSKQLPASEQTRLVDRYYHPYRDRVTAAIEDLQAAGRIVLHLSLHTFTPVWNDQPRSTDIGLLFDPGRRHEAELCADWQRELCRTLPHLRTHRNRPYRGTSDGLTTSLRGRFPASRYLGIELELKQNLFTLPPAELGSLLDHVAAPLAAFSSG